jgi:hypothetical protein
MLSGWSLCHGAQDSVIHHGKKSVLFSTKFCLFHNFIFFSSSTICLFIKHALKFTYQLGHLKAKKIH